MELDRLFEILDIEEIEDFKYFDNFAALVECDEPIDYEEIYYLVSRIESELLAGLIDDYFEDIMGGVPDAETEIYMLLDNIHRALTGICKNTEDENSRVLLSEELMKFRNWYNYDTDVICKNRSKGETRVERVKNALVLYRMEKLNDESYEYDFEDCLNYELDEYVFSLGAPDENETYDYTSGREEEALLESDYLFDDEFSDEY